MHQKIAVDQQKLLHHLNTIEAVFITGLREVASVKGMIEKISSPKMIESDAKLALIKLNHLKKCQRRLLKNQ